MSVVRMTCVHRTVNVNYIGAISYYPKDTNGQAREKYAFLHPLNADKNSQRKSKAKALRAAAHCHFFVTLPANHKLALNGTFET